MDGLESSYTSTQTILYTSLPDNGFTVGGSRDLTQPNTKLVDADFFCYRSTDYLSPPSSSPSRSSPIPPMPLDSPFPPEREAARMRSARRENGRDCVNGYFYIYGSTPK